jgi:uncharacterized protein
MKKNLFGLGLRHKHHKHVLKNLPKVDFFEIHSENFIAEGGASIELLEKISQNYPLSFHCVGLSIASASGISRDHLSNIKKLEQQFKPFIISDHLSWSSSEKATANDLLPIPYTKESLKIFCDNVNFIQDFLGREILIENPSSYLEFKNSEISETDFLNQISKKTGCFLLLDINNVFVASRNFGFDAAKYLDEIDSAKVREIHLAGHSIYKFHNQEIRIDTHSTKICDEVLLLYKNFMQKTKIKVPTLVEWDEEIPEFEVLYSEMEKVKSAI